MATKTKKTYSKTFSITLPEREGKLLKMYALDYGITRPEAIRRMVRVALREYKEAKGNIEPDNQLGLFDAVVQMDIFSNPEVIQDESEL